MKIMERFLPGNDCEDTAASHSSMFLQRSSACSAQPQMKRPLQSACRDEVETLISMVTELLPSRVLAAVFNVHDFDSWIPRN
jgi:hypothetical protein